MLSPMELLNDMRKHWKDEEERAKTVERLQCLAVALKIHPTGNGWPFPTLKHLCRLTVRRSLNDNFQLPRGIEKLPLPECLIRYIRLERA